MKTTAREEIVIELFRGLDREQQGELMKRLRALVHANQVIQKKMRKPIETVGNDRMEAVYGFPGPHALRRKLPAISKPKPRRPDRAQDDNE